MRDFYFHQPNSLAEALNLLDEHQDDGRPMAGGTALVVLMKQSLVDADHLISLDKVPGLSGIRLEADGLHIGALTHHRDVETSAVVKQHAPLLAQAYSQVATVRIRNVATVGGGLAHADPAQDPPPALIVLGASVKIISKGGHERTVPVTELFTDYYETVIQPGELLSEVIVPVQPSNAKAVYLKFLPRTADDYATVAVAALAQMSNGTVSHLRVALGAAGPTPVHATAVESALLGQGVSPNAIRAAADAVAGQVDPLDDFRGSSGYKRDMAVVFTRRALERVLA
ncbi:MAG TPA: xanthine dehydrogenase family protein subunit M [Dehalococcoidia bacterium]|nr:xanthine dehydrogenase family protein subunit M [Dehalococcoidia bacterium]